MEEKNNQANKMMSLERELNKFKAEIVIKNNSLIKTFDETLELLKLIEKDDQTQYIYLNRNVIQKILYDEDIILRINNENINYNGIKSLFYIALAIYKDRDILNYSYNKIFINDLYEKVKKEENDKKKLILYIILDILIENYKQLNNSTESDDTDIKEKISNEIKNYINQNLSLFDEFELNIKSINKNTIDIEELYIKIIISLYRDKKIDNMEYDSSGLLEILDMRNIEPTNKMYESFKKEFDENSSKEYLNIYKIKSKEDLDNEKIINFYYIQFKYIFKIPIYLYNIQFFLDSRNSVKQIIYSDYSILENLLKNNNLSSFEKKKLFVLNTLLDSEYYTLKKDSNKLIFDQLNEICIYYQSFHQKQIDKIKEIKEIMEKQDQNEAKKFMNEYDEAKRKNKRFKFYNSIYKLQLANNKTNEDFNKVVSILDTCEQSIHEKKINLQRLKLRDEIFTFFSDENNKDYIKEIFKQDEIDSFIKFYNINYIIKIYFKNYFFETKKKDIEKIELTIGNKKKYDLDEYLQYLDEAKKKNHLYSLISKLYPIDPKTKTEKYIESKIKDWEDTKNLIEDKKYILVNEEIKIKLYIFFNNEKNKESYKEILDEERYNFLLVKKAEAEEELINYYKRYYPETKKDVIENKKFEDKDYEEYLNLKKIKLREPIILSLFGERIKEKEFSDAKEKWDKMENDIKNRNYNNINDNNRKKIIKFFEKKDEEENKFIKEIFSKEIIDSFINYNKGKQKKKKAQKDNEEMNNDMQDQSLKEDSTQPKTKGKGQSFPEPSEYHIKEEISEKYECINIKNYLNTTMILKNKSIEINDVQIDGSSYSFNIYEDSKKNPNEKKIFKILEDLKKELIEKCANDTNLIIELLFEKQNLSNKDFSLKYNVRFKNSINNKDCFELLTDNKVSNILSDGNIIHNALEKLLKEINKKEINDLKIKEKEKNDLKIKENEINIPQKSTNSQSNQNDITTGDRVINRNSNNDNDPNQITKSSNYNGELSTQFKIFNSFANNNGSREKPEEKSYIILNYEGVIGSHFEYRRNNIVEFLKELKGTGQYLSVGSDKKILKIYDRYFQELKDIEIPEIKDYIYDIYEKKLEKHEQIYILACANKEIYLLKSTLNGGLKVENNWELPNMTCISSLIIEIKEKVKAPRGSKKKNKNNNKGEYTQKNTNIVVVAGRNGIKCLVDIFEGKNKEFDSFNIESEDTYRGLFKISETLIAITSNSIIPGGKNKLIIYNFELNNNKNTWENKGTKRGDKEYEIENYSFIASNSGMASLSENILLCACKKYTKEDKNGILLVTNHNNKNYKSKDENNKYGWTHIFRPTGAFEVHCFCPLIKENKQTIGLINDYEDHSTKSDIFLVGGFDSKLGEGRIKLYSLVRKENEIKGIKFLQDIELPKTGTMAIESRLEQKKTIKIKVFNGAISCLIQSSQNKKILASCYDGRVYLLSEPNLKKYNQ